MSTLRSERFYLEEWPVEWFSQRYTPLAPIGEPPEVPAGLVRSAALTGAQAARAYDHHVHYMYNAQMGAHELGAVRDAMAELLALDKKMALLHRRTTEHTSRPAQWMGEEDMASDITGLRLMWMALYHALYFVGMGLDTAAGTLRMRLASFDERLAGEEAPVQAALAAQRVHLATRVDYAERVQAAAAEAQTTLRAIGARIVDRFNHLSPEQQRLTADIDAAQQESSVW